MCTYHHYYNHHYSDRDCATFFVCPSLYLWLYIARGRFVGQARPTNQTRSRVATNQSHDVDARARACASYYTRGRDVVTSRDDVVTSRDDAAS